MTNLFSLSDIINIVIAVTPTIFAFAKIYMQMKHIEYKISNIEHRMDKAEERQEKFAEQLNNQALETTEIRTTLLAISKAARGTLGERHSPWHLNPLGQKIFDDMHGQQFLDENRDFLFAKIDRYAPQTGYDADEAALTVCILSTGDPRFNRIKNFIYNYPMQKDEQGRDKYVTLEDACAVLSMPLREMYLAAHPEIPTE